MQVDLLEVVREKLTILEREAASPNMNVKVMLENIRLLAPCVTTIIEETSVTSVRLSKLLKRVEQHVIFNLPQTGGNIQ